MSTLKEEMNLIFDTTFDIYGTLDPEYKSNCIDEIIKLIEKKIELASERPPLNEYFGYSGDQEFLDGFDLGFEKALELVEMELEK